MLHACFSHSAQAAVRLSSTLHCLQRTPRPKHPAKPRQTRPAGPCASAWPGRLSSSAGELNRLEVPGQYFPPAPHRPALCWYFLHLQSSLSILDPPIQLIRLYLPTLLPPILPLQPSTSTLLSLVWHCAWTSSLPFFSIPREAFPVRLCPSRYLGSSLSSLSSFPVY